MQTILIPTDFNLTALDCVESICQNSDQEINLIYIHMIKLSDSITDLLMLSRRTREAESISPDFYKRAIELRRQYPQIKNIRAEFFYGSTLSMFRNFLEANEVDAVLNPDNCSLSRLHPSSVDPVALINKSGLPVVSVTLMAKVVKQEESSEAPVQTEQIPVLETEIVY